MTCGSCGDKPKKCNKDFTKAVIEIDNPEQITLMRKVTIPASMGDDTTVPPVVGKYHNVLLYYEANQKSYLYSSDGIPTQLVNGVTDYEAAVNLPQINGVTLLGNKSAADLELADAPLVITVASDNTSWSGADTAEDVYNFFLNKGKVNIVFNGGENYAYEIDSAGYIPEEEKMMCTLTAATITAGETAEFDGNALVGTMTLYTADKEIDVSQIELQPKLFVTDFTGLDLNYNELSGVPATNAAIGMVKPGDGLEVASDGTLSISEIEQYAHFFDTVAGMKASTNLVDGSFAQTLGYYAKNDGGTALYKIRQKAQNETPDEMFVLSIADNTLVAELILHNNTVVPESVGVYGNGTTDTTTTLQSLITYAANNNLTINGNGSYKITDSVTIPNTQHNTIKLRNVDATSVVDKPAFILDHTRYPNIEIESIVFTKGDGSDIHNSYNHETAFLLKSVSYANISVKTVQNSLCVFTLYSDGGSGTDGCYYNKLKCEKADTFNVVHYYNDDGAVNGNELNDTLHIVSEWTNPNSVTFYTIINEAHTDGGTIYKNNHNVVHNLMVEKYTNDGMSYEIADLTDASNFFIYVDRIEINPSLDTAHIVTTNANSQYNLIKINSGWDTIPLANSRFGNNNYVVTFNNYKNTLNNILYINNGGATLASGFSAVTNDICDGTITYNPAVGMVRFNGLFTNADALTSNTNYTFANFTLKGRTCTHGYVYSVGGGNPTNMTQIGTIRRVKNQYYCTMRLSQNVNAGSYLFVDFMAEE